MIYFFFDSCIVFLEQPSDWNIALRIRHYSCIMSERVQDKSGKNINEGDYVYTKYRGGSHEGEVSLQFPISESFPLSSLA